ncbi:glycosyltransferase [Pedobacter cryophilus]|uniref:Glycosyltransferase n=1 Tax=Pedobacter cryophilus TaxID=2571271 RepID=A0A4U1C0Y6_9SPHI|nr:glycosyltransferase [Pedobacter cryophilus]TKB98614.1 glycosyltransferase [Pedobacter cryophilus]
MNKKKILIIHPGVQHAYRLANALVLSDLFSKVSLCTWFLIKPKHPLANFRVFKKRVKDIDKEVSLSIFPFFELLSLLHEKLYFLLFPKKKFSNYNNIQYLWSYFFGIFLVPYLFFNRKNTVLVLYDTCGWPLSFFAKKWKMSVVMDFPSISHESAIALGIQETNYGIALKLKERQYIDFALYCSDFAKESYQEKTSEALHFTAHVGAALPKLEINKINFEQPVLQIAFIANMELRKGLDFLLNVINNLKIPFQLHLIGKISKSWVLDRLDENNLSNGKVVFAGSFNQPKLIQYLQAENIQLHILPSRFDSFGMVVPETMMLGIPNIVSPFVGAGEKITDGFDGFIMQELSSEALNHSILKFYHLSLSEKELISRNAYAQSKLISWEKYNNQIKVVFSTILTTIRPKIAFIVTHPTQFEVPFFQYIFSQKDQVKFDVIYIGTDKQLHYDKEISRKIDWGFDLFEGYNYHITKSRSDLKKILQLNGYELIISNGYNGKYLNILDLMFIHSNKLALRTDSILRNQPIAWKYWKLPILKIAFKLFDHFLVVGNQTRDYILALGKKSNQINFFSYSIDENKFNKINSLELNKLKNKLQLKNHQKVFLCVAKLVSRENPIDVINAFIKCNQPDWTLLIIGDGNSRPDLEAYCKKRDEIDIRFLGYINYVNLPLYYHLSDVFVHSTREENWGVSVHEAIACDCTVITSDTVGSATDLIIEGKNGFIYPFKDVTTLQQKMIASLELDPNVQKEENRKILLNWGYVKMWNEIKQSLIYR